MNLIALAAILADLVEGFYTFQDAIAALQAVGQAIPEEIFVSNSVIRLTAWLRGLLGGQNVAACTNTHSAKAQGPGTCCAVVPQLIALQPGGVLPRTLPVYVKGSRNTLTGVQVQTAPTTANPAGECGQCYLVGSKSVSHPGTPRLLFLRGGGTCPSSKSGCCALTAAGGV